MSGKGVEGKGGRKFHRDFSLKKEKKIVSFESNPHASR